jgi:signal peptidase I
MLTLSMVDIDKDESGEPKAHFLIKRAVGMGGDRFIMERGEMRVRFAGEDRWVDERDYQAGRNWKHRISRLMDVDQYPALEAMGKQAAYADLGLPAPGGILSVPAGINNLRYPDYLAHERARLETLRGAWPQDERYRALLARYQLGWYVPEGRILPLGDNRDNSRDGRYFGPVKESKILGQGALIYWPLRRMGPIR